MRTFKKSDLVNKLYSRFGGAITKSLLKDAVQVIVEDLFDRIANDDTVSIENFGTLHQYEYKSRKNIDINTKEARKTKSFNNVQFIPDLVFSEMINKKRSFFKKENKV